MSDAPEDEVLATVSASIGRRILGIGLLSLLAVMVIWMAVTKSPAFGWQIFLIGLGITALMIADAMRRSTACVLELTTTMLREKDGRIIARIDEITDVERGAFAFKPSNGFLLTTSTRNSRAWRPGVWWRMGRKIGIGGMLPGRQTKFMSEIIAVRLAEREVR
ncbi:hypothetical protein [Roseobacter sp.]|uniref:hypothetical protein n=1 Tax=Roseobacter sp. TaxID=1907202 RepID=UPI0025F1A3E4|nr:hypothetical protein [Roseobacter sp.]